MTFISDEDYDAIVGSVFKRYFELDGKYYYVDRATDTGYHIHQIDKPNEILLQFPYKSLKVILKFLKKLFTFFKNYDIITIELKKRRQQK